uniref:Variant surface glycoprotein 1125.113 n=1 Tax=Trypanosoma brucei TaxID=5691 RepID=A0A1J0R551_9TRYP|nr:variant surface glycoprotein 1125.113 [Trypanosoma brucei]
MHLTKFSAGFAALVLASIGAQAAVGPNENSGIFKALCTLISFAESPPPLQPAPGDGTTEIAELQALNMSLAPSDWQAKLNTADPGDDDAKIKQKSGLSTDAEVQDFKKRWASWAAARKATNETSETKTKIEKAGFQKLSGAARAAAAIRVRAAAERAQHFYELRAKLQETLSSPTDTEVKKELQEAAFGKEGKKLGTATVDEMFADANAASRAAACSGRVVSAGPKTIAAMLMCICAESQTAHNGWCAHKMGVSASWSSMTTAPSAATGAWNAIKTACVPSSQASLSAEAIRQQIRDLAMAIHPSSSNHFLGAIEGGTDCDGQNTGGLCVKYTGYNPAAGKGLEATQWGKKLATLANKLEQRNKAIQEATFLLKAIQAEATAAMATAGQTATAEWPTAPSSAAQTGAQTAGKKSKASDAEEECNAAGEDKTECDKLEKQGCVFNTESKKCELKKDVKKALEKAKENEGTSTTVDCSKLLTQQACEDANKDGKKHCGWKNGKDNEDDKDKEKCRNGSFLANKQFVLMVSAFVALLF